MSIQSSINQLLGATAIGANYFRSKLVGGNEALVAGKAEQAENLAEKISTPEAGKITKKQAAEKRALQGDVEKYIKGVPALKGNSIISALRERRRLEEFSAESTLNELRGRYANLRKSVDDFNAFKGRLTGKDFNAKMEAVEGRGTDGRFKSYIER